MPGIRKFIAKVQKTAFIVGALRCEREHAHALRSPENIEMCVNHQH